MPQNKKSKIVSMLIVSFLVFQPLAVILAEETTVTTYPSKYYNEDSNGKATKHIFANGIEIASIEDGEVKYLHTDHLDSTSVVTNNAGEIIETVDYFPYGNIRIDEKSSAFSEQRKYIGEEYDESTGLNYLNARYYDSKQGQFLSQDPVFQALGNTDEIKKLAQIEQNKLLEDPQSLNSYSYARNNPITLSDPKGEYWTISASGTALGLSGEIGFRFDLTGFNFFTAGGAGIGFKGSPLSVSYSPGEVNHTTESRISIGGNAASLVGFGVSRGGEYQPDTYRIKNPSTEASLIIGAGADVYVRKEISIPILGRKSSTGDSILNKPTYLSAKKSEESQTTSNNIQYDYYLYPGKYTNTAQPSDSIINSQQKSRIKK